MTTFNTSFWAATAERAIKTFAQSAAALLGGDGLGVLDVDWVAIGSVAALATIVSVLTSIASAPIGLPGPALGSGETVGDSEAVDYRAEH